MIDALLIFFLSHTSFAAIHEYKPLALATNADDRLLIRGYAGRIRLAHGRAGQLLVKVKQETDDNAPAIVKQSFDEWNFSLQRNGNVVELIVQSPQSKEVWRQLLLTQTIPRFHLEITAPSMSTEIAWRSGDLDVDKWMAPLQIAWQEGKVNVSGGEGEVQVVGQNVDVKIKGRKGKAIVDSYEGKFQADNVVGDIDASVFSGEASVLQSEGSTKFRTYRAPLVISGGKGLLEFDSVRGNIKLDNFRGDVRGTADEANVSGRIIGANEVRIATQSGPVQLDLPNSGAQLSASSSEGTLIGPNHIKVEQFAGFKVMRGRLKGGEDGTVVIKTQSGSVRLR